MVLIGVQDPEETEIINDDGENRIENIFDHLQTKILNLKLLSFEYLRERSPGHLI